MEDRDIATKLKTVMDNAGKDNLGTIRLPIAIVGSIGVPEEIIPAIDFKRIILDNCNMLYTILESIGFYRKPDRLISELGY
jgi:5'(3')-deoxyribonucleotidase